MVIMGAGGHAVEVFDVIMQDTNVAGLHFYDDFSSDTRTSSLGKASILRNEVALERHFNNRPNFTIGVGSPRVRRLMYRKAIKCGGSPQSIVAKNATIGSYNVSLGLCLNIMNYAMISSNVTIGDGCLLNARCSIHHDTVIGDFCEIGPNATITGGVLVGKGCSIGAGATIIPGVRIADNITIGAGAVVTKDVKEQGVTLVGVPAKKL